MSTDAPIAPLSRRQRIQVASQLWLLNVLACALLCGKYLQALEPTSWQGWFFLQGGRWSCAASLSVLPGLLAVVSAVLLRSRWILGLVSGVLWSLFLFSVYVDTRIYGIFRYHFNGLVWNVLTTPGADEAVHLSPSDLRMALLSFGALVPIQCGALFLLWRWVSRRALRSLPTPVLARPGLAWGLVLVPNMLAVAGVYAHADLVRDAHVMAFARVYPLYPRLTVKRFASRYLGLVLKERPEVDIPEQGIQLDYPVEAPVLTADGPRPNVVVVVIDSLRADMLTPEVMPRCAELATRARVFQDHLSSGNATRFGLFGLLYGLHGSYWKPVYDEHRSPALVDSLLAGGYELRVLTSASMDFPEFRSTAWVRVEDQVEDRLPTQRPGGRDDGVARRFEEWLSEREAPESPFFAFLLLDAPHQGYSFPAECARFRPYADDVAYAAIAEGASEEVREELFNRYRNAVHYADQITGRVIDALVAHELFDGTLLVVTGDHGEEFFENGLWGHTSNFTRAQVQVPFVLAGPGIPIGVETRPTCHIDLPATLLELLGADPAMRGRWTLGSNLLDPAEQRVRVVSGWETLGLHVPGGIFEVPLATHGGAEIAVFDPRWQPVFDDDEMLRREGKSLGVLALECRRFMR